MQRLERFKWIPMLLRAWDEARERTEAERRGRITSPEGETEMGAVSAPAKSTRSQGKSTNRDTKAIRPPVRRAAPPVQSLPRPARGRKQDVRTRIRKSDYQAVLQELREAKKQLGQLDSIRHQLDDLQAWFETRMAAAEKTAAKPVNRPTPPFEMQMPGQMQLPSPPLHVMPSQGATVGHHPQGQQVSSDRIGQEPGRHTEAQKEDAD
ncbi:hypothetical protein [Alicyclobacillus sp. ALC3]|uniref:hypothetical protein n=1 Tax=Alicyclobacillus sp. ALC3 TaxID=2796143 RepID=UPI002379699F|nr:hypothetical protein [Alicyclobacillus sp. ALC3]WDL98219.1 hypothetical protein JC200_05830 [Alicyclobacillus sp. ALC3]